MNDLFSVPAIVEVGGVPGGFDAIFFAEVIDKVKKTGVFIAHDDVHLSRMAQALGFLPHILNNWSFLRGIVCLMTVPHRIRLLLVDVSTLSHVY